MLEKFKHLLGSSSSSVRQSELKPEMPVAVSAVLLEMAGADGEFAESERATIVVLLQEHFGLSGQEVEELIAATQAERAKTPDLWPFTYAIRRTYSPEEKEELLVMVWQVIFADQVLDAHEEMLVHQLQPMLAVNHSVVIAAKLKAREAGPVV